MNLLLPPTPPCSSGYIASLQRLVRICNTRLQAVVNDQIKAKIVSSGSIVDGKTQGQKFLEIYYEASLLFSYVGKPTIENILSHDLDNMLKDFTTLKSLWDALTVSGAFDSVSEEDKKELSELIVEINNILEDDEVVK